MRLALESKVIEVDRAIPPEVVIDEGVTYHVSYLIKGSDQCYQYRRTDVLDTSTLS